MRALKECFRFLLVLSLMGVALLIIVFAYTENEEALNQKVVDSGYPFRTDEELNQAKKYHGVNALEIVNNEWVFYRDGKPCRVFAYKEKQ